MSAGALLTADEVDAYLGAVDWLIGVVGHEEVGAAWSSPSSLATYTTGGVACHAVQGGITRLRQVLQEPEPMPQYPVSVADFYGPNRVVAQADDEDALFAMLRSAAEAVAGDGQAALVASANLERRELAGLLATATEDRAVPVLRIPGGTVRLADYLRTRVLEVVVHGDDVLASVTGLTLPEPPRAAVEVCLVLCLELARSRIGGLGALRAFTRRERTETDELRVL